MSVLAVLFFAGVTALTAAIVTVLTAAMAAGNVNRRGRKRHMRQLQGPVPGHRSLSGVGLKAEENGLTPASSSPEPPVPVQVRAGRGPAPAPSAAQGMPAAASAAQGKPPGQQGRPPRKTPAVSAMAAASEPAPQVAAPSPRPASAVPPEPAPDAIADLDKFLQELQLPAGAQAVDAPADGSALDFLAGLDEPEMAAAGVDADLIGIDGGGLPAPATTPKPSQKTRR